jgi:hypothetical protein
MTQANRVHYLNLLRILLCAVIVLFPKDQYIFVWLPISAWAVLCIKGIILSLPYTFLLFLSAAGAQADWMSDSNANFTFFILPTLLSIFVEARKWMKSKKANRKCTCSRCIPSSRIVSPAQEKSKT